MDNTIRPRAQEGMERTPLRNIHAFPAEGDFPRLFSFDCPRILARVGVERAMIKHRGPYGV
ncbi:hypothetical protein VMCG_02545 [Cytospora schulzeri]|uniref:Uncharacterized protein n=1 Tax=Cytospora schulzeri TaxID=448051 RepID=A0A423X0H1_9PEZI|nr:hypothetical protein VMCG_02545 [Valsa malicola]